MEPLLAHLTIPYLLFELRNTCSLESPPDLGLLSPLPIPTTGQLIVLPSSSSILLAFQSTSTQISKILKHRLTEPSLHSTPHLQFYPCVKTLQLRTPSYDSWKMLFLLPLYSCFWCVDLVFGTPVFP